MTGARERTGKIEHQLLTWTRGAKTFGAASGVKLRSLYGRLIFGRWIRRHLRVPAPAVKLIPRTFFFFFLSDLRSFLSQVWPSVVFFINQLEPAPPPSHVLSRLVARSSVLRSAPTLLAALHTSRYDRWLLETAKTNK